MTRILIDKLLRAGIKLCMLTGVAFTFAACYAPAPGYWDYWEEPEYEEAQQKVEQQIHESASENRAVAGTSEEV